LDAVQDVRHLEVDLGDSNLRYQPGDSLGMWPETPPPLVDEFLRRCKLQGAERVHLTGGEGGEGGGEVTVRDLVRGALDITSVPPRRYFFEVRV
jgi:sulfite reductase alpha subunit-like flavoprotein